jgi:hypothetical protein
MHEAKIHSAGFRGSRLAFLMLSSQDRGLRMDPATVEEHELDWKSRTLRRRPCPFKNA